MNVKLKYNIQEFGVEHKDQNYQVRLYYNNSTSLEFTEVKILKLTAKGWEYKSFSAYGKNAELYMKITDATKIEAWKINKN